MYTRVGQAIRQVDTNHILFLEHNYFCNPGVPSQIKIPATGKNGTRDNKVAYAPHGYDLLLDTKAYSHAGNKRVSYLLNVIEQTSSRLNIPVMVGEWGAFHSMDSAFYRQGKSILDIFMKRKMGETFWCYFNGIEKYTFFKVLNRPYPMAVNGKLENYSFDPEDNRFSAVWFSLSSLENPSLFYLPSVTPEDEVKINIVPEGGGYRIRYHENKKGAVVSVNPMKKSGLRNIFMRY